MKELSAIIEILKAGGIGVLPTDTIYGIVGPALDKKAVLRIYKVRRRNPKKPMIVLISKIQDLSLFGAEPSAKEQSILKEVWPGKVSVVLKLKSRKFAYLDRGTRTLAFRLPRSKKLAEILKATGPLVAPSANLEGKPPSQTVKEAMDYFGDTVNFYFDAGTIKGEPSVLISLINGKIKVIRGQLKAS